MINKKKVSYGMYILITISYLGILKPYTNQPYKCLINSDTEGIVTLVNDSYIACHLNSRITGYINRDLLNDKLKREVDDIAI